jgi:acyl-CoA thioesterase YciA
MAETTMKNLTTIAGEPMIRTLPRPADSNASGDIFGGWVLSQMDIAGAIPATERAGGRVATVAIDAMVFHEPIFVGDVVSLYAEVTKVGRTSLTVKIETIALRRTSRELVRVTEGMFVYVALDKSGKPRPVPPGS